MNAVDILRAARAKISDPQNWTREESARDDAGYPVEPLSHDAVCWCARGAISAAAKSGDEFQASNVLRRAIREQAPDGRITDFNDKHDHAEVLAAFDRAIQLAEAQ